VADMSQPCPVWLESFDNGQSLCQIVMIVRVRTRRIGTVDREITYFPLHQKFFCTGRYAYRIGQIGESMTRAIFDGVAKGWLGMNQRQWRQCQFADRYRFKLGDPSELQKTVILVEIGAAFGVWRGENGNGRTDSPAQA